MTFTPQPYPGIDHPSTILPNLFSFAGIKEPNTWRWVNIADLMWILSERTPYREKEDFAALGNSNPDGTITCVVQDDEDLKLIDLSSEELNSWCHHFQTCTNSLSRRMKDVHCIFVPAGFAMNILRARLPKEFGGKGPRFHLHDQPTNKPEIDPSRYGADARMEVATFRQSTYSGYDAGNLVMLASLMGNKLAKTPSEVDMWAAGFDHKPDSHRLILTAVAWFVDSYERVGSDEWERKGHWEVVKFTATEFNDHFDKELVGSLGMTRTMYVPAFFAANVLKNVTTTGTGSGFSDPASKIPVGKKEPARRF